MVQVHTPALPPNLGGKKENKMKEEWRPIPGYEGHYEVSNKGRVRSLTRIVDERNGSKQKHHGKLLTTSLNGRGYLRVKLYRNGTQRSLTVHRLVAKAFLGAPENDALVCCHNNGIKTDNRVTNLRWDTLSSNYHDMEKHGTNPWLNREECPRGHPLIEPNLSPWAWKKGRRNCLSCARSRALARKRGEQDYYKYADGYLKSLMEESSA